eukprot:m51a1_g6731 hypothetical protein (150) ;mRNA; r:194298-195079
MADDDADLQAIRAKRMAEMQAQAGMRASPEQMAAQQEQRRMAEEQRNMFLQQILTYEARERLSRIALVKPDKARRVEDYLLHSAQTGRIKSKVDEGQLISLLEQIAEKTKVSTTITIKRRGDDSDDDMPTMGSSSSARRSRDDSSDEDD